MAEILTKIYAPDLGENYGANIKTTFDNINKNFGVIGSKGFSEGPAGDGWKFDSIALSSLLDGDDNKYVDGIITAIGDTGVAADVNALINQLKGSSMPITVGRVNSDLPDTDEPWENSYPIVFIDERFTDLDSVDHGAVDLSGMLVLAGIENSGSVITSTTWSYSQPFPTLYYKTVEGVGGFYWKINGNKTDIPAQGPVGPSGKDGRFWLVRINSDSSVSGGNAGLTYYMNADSTSTSWRNDWDNFEGKNGDSCIVIKDGDISEYWISNIHKVNDDSFEAWVGDSNKMVVTQNFDEQTFFNLMKHVTPSADYTKSLFVKAYDSDNTCAFGSDGDGVMKIGMAANDGALRSQGTSWRDDLDDPLIVIGGRVATQYEDAESIGYNIVRGVGSHAEGYHTNALGDYSHAEGWDTEAFNDQSHAEGYETHAKGLVSHAEGYHTIANGDYSHTEGEGTVSIGVGSHVEGGVDRSWLIHEGTLTHNSGDSDYEWIFNEPTPVSIPSFLPYDYILISGEPYIISCFNEESSNSDGITQFRLYLYQPLNNFESGSSVSIYRGGSVGKYSHSEGLNTMAGGDYSHAEGEGTVTIFDGEHACGKYNQAGKLVSAALPSGTIYTIFPAIPNKDEHLWYIDLDGRKFELHTSGGEPIIFSVGVGTLNDRRTGFLVTPRGPFKCDNTSDYMELYEYNSSTDIYRYVGRLYKYIKL